MERSEIKRWLDQSEPEALEALFRRADEVRFHELGDGVLIRGLIEIGNACRRACRYCGLRAGNHALERYQMSDDEILKAVASIRAFGHGTVVLQAGEHEAFSRERIGALIGRIKAAAPRMAVTLCLGEQDEETLACWRRAGADRYLLKFETSDEALFRRIHPPSKGGAETRLPFLAVLRDLGYEVGSGIMIGIPGQTIESIADDLARFVSLGLDMVAVGPYLPHEDTPLGARFPNGPPDAPNQAPSSSLFTLKVIALARLLCPRAHIPATTALSTVDDEGYEKALTAGADVIMHNLTPHHFKERYTVYHSASRTQDSDSQWRTIRRAVEACGRRIL